MHYVITRLAYEIILADLVWRFQPQPPNHQIEFPIKFSGYTVYFNVRAGIRFQERLVS